MISDRLIPMLDSTNSLKNNQNLESAAECGFFDSWFLRREMAIAFSFVRSTSAIAIYFTHVTRRPQSIPVCFERCGGDPDLFPKLTRGTAAIAIYFCQLPYTGSSNAYIAFEILVCLSVEYFSIIIIDATYQFCYILMSLRLNIYAKLLSLPHTILCDKSRLLLFLYVLN